MSNSTMTKTAKTLTLSNGRQITIVKLPHLLPAPAADVDGNRVCKQELILPNTPTIGTKISDKAIWSHEATLALLASVGGRFDDLQNVSKRRSLWGLITDDLRSQGFEYSEKTCSKKWDNLMRSYRSVKENSMRCGKGSTRFAYYLEMENLLGNSQTYSSPHVFDTGTIATTTVTGENRFEVVEEEEEEGVQVEAQVDQRVAKRKNPNSDEWDMEYLKLKKKMYEKKAVQQKDFQERMLSLEKEKIELQRKKLLLEERKVVALERLVEIQQSQSRANDQSNAGFALSL